MEENGEEENRKVVEDEGKEINESKFMEEENIYIQLPISMGRLGNDNKKNWKI